ncbi:MAG: hypothetical protein HY996_08310 [Micrococcales bacterium]|nr:hypothetical protein [Micrococcales bacterium]
MPRTFSLADPAALDDLDTFVDRAGRIEEGAVRLIAGAGVLAAYAAALYPVGLTDETPTVLGLRTYAVDPDGEFFDAVVPIRSFLQRIESARLRAAKAGSAESSAAVPREPQVDVNLPMEVNTVTWAGISPPRGGWHATGERPVELFRAAAESGIAEMAGAVPDAVGEQLVRRARAEVWGRPIVGLEHIPAGAAFAQYSLGFLGDDLVRLYESGPWSRLTTQRGHVLVKRRAWTLAR